MKLRKLEMEQFRKFERPVSLSGFSDKLNVLCGPNELGKSTILAAIRGLLFERHSSKAEPVRAMQPFGGKAAPRIAMEFEVNSARWRIEKRFLHQPWARLTNPDGHSFEGDAAEEELQRLLGFGAAGKKGATAEQLGVWGALWVTQRQSLEQADLSSGLARSTVLSCLDSEVGVLTGSEKGQSIIRVVSEQLAQLIDGNSRPRGRYKDLLAEIGEIDRLLADLAGREKRLSEDSDAYRQAVRKLEKITDAETIRQEGEALENARRRKEAALVFDGKRKQAVAEYELASSDCNSAEQEQSVRSERRKLIVAAQTARSDAAKALTDARSVLREASDMLAKCQEADSDAQTSLQQATETVRCRRKAHAIAQRVESMVDLVATLKQAESVQNKITIAEAKLESNRVDKDMIAAIRTAKLSSEQAEARLQAQATMIDFELETTSTGRVTLNGTEMSPGYRTITAIQPTGITIAGIGRIFVRPATGDLDELMSEIREVKSRLDVLLGKCDCRDPESAEEKWNERVEFEAALREARKTLMQLTPGDHQSKLEAGVDAMRQRIEIVRMSVEAERLELQLSSIPNAKDALADVRTAEAEEMDARDDLTQVRAELDAATKAFGDAQLKLVRSEMAESSATADLIRLCRDDVEAVTRESDEALAERLAKAQIRCRDSVACQSQLDRQQSPDTVGAMETRIQRYEQAQANRAAAERTLRETIAERRARITQEGGAGLSEAIAAAQGKREALYQQSSAFEKEVSVLNLLLDTLRTAERETKERYLAPVVRRVTPYLRGLFPGAQIECDQSLRITGLARDGSGLQEFQHLSDGTQEQIAILARIAFAELLTDQGKPAMLILDDALAYSDDERIIRMFDILYKAATRTQILILSCREDVFGQLGGTRLELVHAN
jgi:DNA repair exonuclease SbcCD ATPase subunit